MNASLRDFQWTQSQTVKDALQEQIRHMNQVVKWVFKAPAYSHELFGRMVHTKNAQESSLFCFSAEQLGFDRNVGKGC